MKKGEIVDLFKEIIEVQVEIIEVLKNIIRLEGTLLLTLEETN